MSLTSKELKLISMTADMWNGYIDLPAVLDFDKEEMARDIHSIQQRIMARLARRLHPEIFGEIK